MAIRVPSTKRASSIATLLGRNASQMPDQKLPVPRRHQYHVVEYDQLLHRITGRRICPACKSIYNIYSNPPKAEGSLRFRQCSVLVQRS